MNSTLKSYMDSQHMDRVADTVICNFEKTTGWVLADDSKKFVSMVTEKTFDRYAMEIREEILVGPGEKEKLDGILDDFVTNLSNLMVHYIYSKLEAYVLFKRVKELENKDL